MRKCADFAALSGKNAWKKDRGVIKCESNLISPFVLGCGRIKGEGTFFYARLNFPRLATPLIPSP